MAPPTSAKVAYEYVQATPRNVASGSATDQRLCKNSMKYREYPPILTKKVMHAASLYASKLCYFLFSGFSCLLSRVCRRKLATSGREPGGAETRAHQLALGSWTERMYGRIDETLPTLLIQF